MQDPTSFMLFNELPVRALYNVTRRLRTRLPPDLGLDERYFSNRVFILVQTIAMIPCKVSKMFPGFCMIQVRLYTNHIYNLVRGWSQGMFNTCSGILG